MSIDLRRGDCRESMQLMDLFGEQVDSIVTDPPYGLGFMGRSWDKVDTPFRADFWRDVMPVLKPGGYMLVFGGTRTFHRVAVAIEDAGFEIRDTCMWLYGSGFPKSQNVGKFIDKHLGAERTEVRGVKPGHEGFAGRGTSGVKRDEGSQGGKGGFHRPWMDDEDKANAYHQDFAPATDEATAWDGWGTALKPAWEPVIVARKPLSEKSVAANVLKHGTGALNIDGCRLDGSLQSSRATGETTQGRWPANVLHDGSDEVIEAFAAYGGGKGAAAPVRGDEPSSAIKNAYGDRERVPGKFHGDTGSASRFFYSAKAGRKDRAGSKHPTVKPVSLMAYLCRLVTPPGGTVLDPFAGSGTTGQAALDEGFNAILCEREAEYIADIERRFGIAEEPAA